MQRYPRFQVEAYVSSSHGSRCIGLEDLTLPALRAISMRTPGHDVTLRLSDLMDGLSAQAHQAAEQGHLVLPELATKFRAFISDVEALGGTDVYRTHLHALEMSRQQVMAGADLLKDVGDAAIISGWSGPLANPLTGEILDEFEDFQWGRGALSRLASSILWDGKELADAAPPFAFATETDKWYGFDACRLANFLRAGGTDLRHFLGEELGSFALTSELIEVWRLEEAAADFIDTMNTPDAEVALADAVARWNEIQDVSILKEDRTRVLPVAAGVSREKIVGWCVDNLRTAIDLHRDLGSTRVPRFVLRRRNA